MSITLKTGQIKARTKDGMTPIDCIVGDTAEQINAIKEAGAQTLETIPDDYTELVNDVNQLKSDVLDVGKTSNVQRVINILNCCGVIIDYSFDSPVTFTLCGKNLLDAGSAVLGKICDDSGVEVSDNTSGYFAHKIAVIPTEVIFINFGAQRIYQYDENGKWLRRTINYGVGDRRGAWQVPDDCYYVSFQYSMLSINIDTPMVHCGVTEAEYHEYIGESVNVVDSGMLPLKIMKVYEDGRLYADRNISFSVSLLDKLKDSIQRKLLKLEYDMQIKDTETVERVKITESKVYIQGTDTTQIINVCGKNLLDKDSNKIGKIRNDSGDEVTDNTSSYFDKFIAVIPGETLYCNFGVQRFYEYDADKIWVRRTDSFPIANVKGTWIVPDDCYYIQVQYSHIASLNIDRPQIERNDVGTTYESYYSVVVVGSENNQVNIDGIKNISSDSEFIVSEVYDLRDYIDSKVDKITIPGCKTYELWKPSDITDDYKQPLGSNAVCSLSLSDLYSLYFNKYVASNDIDGYSVKKKSLGNASDHYHELYEYDFCPKHYNRVVLLSAGMNPIELSPIFGLCNFIKSLMDVNVTDPGMVYLRENVRFKVIPMINPWGYEQSPLKYTNTNDVRINKNFNWRGSFATMRPQDKAGEYPDSEAETQILKRWINENANVAELWIDCHSDTAGDSNNWVGVAGCMVSHSEVVNIIRPVQLQIEDYYKALGTMPSDETKSRCYVPDLTYGGYPKTNYAHEMCDIDAIMIEQYPLCTWYGNDGETQAGKADIENYVLMIRAYMLAMLKRGEKIFKSKGNAWDSYHFNMSTNKKRS